MPGEVQNFLQADAMDLCGFARLRDGRVPQSVGPDLQTDAVPKPTNDLVEADRAKPAPLVCSVEIAEQGAWLLPYDVQPTAFNYVSAFNSACGALWSFLAFQPLLALDDLVPAVGERDTKAVHAEIVGAVVVDRRHVAGGEG